MLFWRIESGFSGFLQFHNWPLSLHNTVLLEKNSTFLDPCRDNFLSSEPVLRSHLPLAVLAPDLPILAAEAPAPASATNLKKTQKYFMF